MAVKTHKEVTPFYRHFESSETFGIDSHQVRNTITGKVDACADVFPWCWGQGGQISPGPQVLEFFCWAPVVFLGEIFLC